MASSSDVLKAVGMSPIVRANLNIPDVGIRSNLFGEMSVDRRLGDAVLFLP